MSHDERHRPAPPSPALYLVLPYNGHASGCKYTGPRGSSIISRQPSLVSLSQMRTQRSLTVQWEASTHADSDSTTREGRRGATVYTTARATKRQPQGQARHLRTFPKVVTHVWALPIRQKRRCNRTYCSTRDKKTKEVWCTERQSH